MAIYNPPTETLPIFDTSVFTNDSAGLTTAEGDLRYLRFPVSQGGETISGDLAVSGTSTLGVVGVSGTATINGGIFTQTSPQYKIDYPVNSGRIDFYSNTAGGVSTRGCKIDATGVHTLSKFDTIDETAGTLDIGNLNARSGTINIGTGSSGKLINIGGAAAGAVTTLTGNTLTLNPAIGGFLNLGVSMTNSGTISIGRTDGTATNTTINMGAGAAYSGTVNINSGAGTGTTNIGRNVIQIVNSGSSSLTIQRPIQLSNTANPASFSAAIGYIMPLVTGSGLGAIAVPANTYTWSTGLLTLDIGVWMLSLEARMEMGASPTSTVYNMGYMNSAPITGDSATASSAPASTLSGVNGNNRNSDPTTYTTGTYIFNVGGVVVNNYTGTYNSMYGIFNADWTAGTIDMTSLSIRAVRIG